MISRAALGLAIGVGVWQSPVLAACQIAKLAELPVTMVGLRPTITAQINGTDATLLVDSGSFWSVLTRAGAEQFKLRLGPPRPGLDFGGIGGQTQYGTATVDVFTLAHFKIPRMDFIVAGSDMGGGAVGLIGQNILRSADVEYDLANGVIRLMHPTGCEHVALVYWDQTHPYSDMNIDPTSTLQPHTIASAYINGRKIRVLFDTGAQVSLLTRRAAQIAGVTPDSPGVTAVGYTRGFGPVGVRTWIAPFASFKIGDEEIRNIRVRIGDTTLGNADMLLGDDFFLAHRIYVASSRNKMYFTYNGGPVFNLTASLAGDSSTSAPPAASPAPAGATGSAPAASAPATPQSAAAAASAIADEPTDAAGFSRRGAAFAARLQYARAIADFTRACQLDPNEPHYFEQRGFAELYLKQSAQALSDFDRAIELQSDDAMARLARARLLFAAHDQAKGLQDLDAVDRVAPKEADLRLTLAAEYLSVGRFPAAVAQYDVWLASHGDDIRVASALNGRCWARGMWGQDVRKALGDCNAALRLAPKDSELHAAALDSRGLVRLRLGDYAHSLEDYDAALRVRPKLAGSLYGRGLDELRLGHAQAAHTDMASAIALQPNIAEVFRGIGLGP